MNSLRVKQAGCYVVCLLVPLNEHVGYSGTGSQYITAFVYLLGLRKLDHTDQDKTKAPKMYIFKSISARGKIILSSSSLNYQQSRTYNTKTYVYNYSRRLRG